MNCFHTFFIVLIVLISSNSQAENKIVIAYHNLEYSVSHIMAERVLTVAYSRIGQGIEFEKSPAERSLVNANSGLADGELARIAGIEVKYPNLIMIPVSIAYAEVLVYSKNYNFKVDGWISLSPYTIGYVSGSKIIEKKTKGMSFEKVTSASQGLRKLNLGRTDVFIALKGIQCLIDKLELTDIKAIDQPLERLVMYHYIHKKHSQMARNLGTVLRQMKESGEMDSIQRQSALDFLNQCNNVNKSNE